MSVVTRAASLAPRRSLSWVTHVPFSFPNRSQRRSCRLWDHVEPTEDGVLSKENGGSPTPQGEGQVGPRARAAVAALQGYRP